MGMGVLPAERAKKCQAPIKLAQLFPAPELRAEILWSALGKWGRTQMGSDGFNRILTRLYLLGPARVRPVPSKTHDFKEFLPDFNRILTVFQGIWLRTAWPPPWPTPFILCQKLQTPFVPRKFGAKSFL